MSPAGPKRWEEGINDLLAHRLEYALPLVLTLGVVCGATSLIGFAFDHEGGFGDSVGAGIGLLVGLVLWVSVLAWFFATGAVPELRRKREQRRREAHIEEVRRRRST